MAAATTTLSHFITLLIITAARAVMGREYCEDEVFTATCPEDEVIIISRAEYGRMRVGRCIESSFGYPLGCSENVQINLDRWCSGRQKCEVDVAQLLRDIPSPCPKELRSYLEANYTCVPVISGQEKECTSRQAVMAPVTSQEGYIASLVAMQTGCGSIDSPWLITVSPGQHISMTLYDFSVINSLNTQTEDSMCLVYAIIKETSGSPTQTICGGKVRESQAYTSLSNSVEVRVVSKRQQQAQEGFFLLRYEAIGCPKPYVPEGGWIERKKTTATIGCDHSRDQWELKCVGRDWVGKQFNCTTAGQGAPVSLDAVLDIPSLPRGSSLLIIVGVACLVGLGVLIVGVVCLRRRYRRPAQAHIERSPALDDPYATTIRMDRDCKNPRMMDPYRENQYYRTWQLQQRGARSPPGGNIPVPPPPYDVTNGGANQDGRYVEHIYESPKFERREMAPHSCGSEDHGHVKYFELDPSVSVLHKGNSSRDNLSTSTSGYRSDSLPTDRVDL